MRICGKCGKQLHLSHSSNLSALAHFQWVLSTQRDQDDKRRCGFIHICYCVVECRTTVKAKKLWKLHIYWGKRISGCIDVSFCLLSTGSTVVHFGFLIFFSPCTPKGSEWKGLSTYLCNCCSVKCWCMYGNRLFSVNRRANVRIEPWTENWSSLEAIQCYVPSHTLLYGMQR